MILGYHQVKIVSAIKNNSLRKSIKSSKIPFSCELPLEHIGKCTPVDTGKNDKVKMRLCFSKKTGKQEGNPFSWASSLIFL